MSDCIFCKIIAGEIPSAKIYEDELREVGDALIKGDNFSQIWSDIKADERGIRGGSLKKSLRESCPTHHTKYK